MPKEGDRPGVAPGREVPLSHDSGRFGSRAFARALLPAAGVPASGRHPRAGAAGALDDEADGGGRAATAVIERREASVSVAPPARASRRRLLPFEVLLTSATGARPLFEPGPFDELRCAQRVVPAGRGARHDVEYLAWRGPTDQGRHRAFGCFRLDEAEPLVDLRRQQAFWLRLRAERGIRTLPQARVRGPRTAPCGAPREGVLQLEPALASGPYSRSGQPTLDARDVAEVVRRARGPERVAWLEEAFRAEPAAGTAVHRYYLDADLTAWLVRHEGSSKVLAALRPSAEARDRGLLFYPRRA